MIARLAGAWVAHITVGRSFVFCQRVLSIFLRTWLSFAFIGLAAGSWLRMDVVRGRSGARLRCVAFANYRLGFWPYAICKGKCRCVLLKLYNGTEEGEG